jgi:hypothetical protein
MSSFILPRLYVFMGYLRRLFPIEGLNSPLIFGESLHDAMGTTLTFGTTYHPQTDGQTKRVNQILGDMLRACTIICGKD